MSRILSGILAGLLGPLLAGAVLAQENEPNAEPALSTWRPIPLVPPAIPASVTLRSHTKVRELVPATLDNSSLGVGDMHGLACRQNIPLNIIEVRVAHREGLKKIDFPKFVAALNKRLAYLSDGLFSLDLKRIHFMELDPSEMPDAHYYRRVEDLARTQKSDESFLMIVGPQIDGGSYQGHGVLKIASDELDLHPFNRKVVHELLHALISPAHSTSRLSTLRQYNFVIGLTPEEARFLNWPVRPPVLPDSSTYFPD